MQPKPRLARRAFVCCLLLCQPTAAPLARRALQQPADQLVCGDDADPTAAPGSAGIRSRISRGATPAPVIGGCRAPWPASFGGGGAEEAGVEAVYEPLPGA